MKIEPLKDTVYLNIEKPKAGALNLESTKSAIEFGEVIAVGSGVGLNVGDKVFVKAWAIDIVSYQDETYYFCNINTNGILARVYDL
jgi:co-chaperonin GroES (HSP10)